jgi:hypothetical protein
VSADQKFCELSPINANASVRLNASGSLVITAPSLAGCRTALETSLANAAPYLALAERTTTAAGSAGKGATEPPAKRPALGAHHPSQQQHQHPQQQQHLLLTPQSTLTAAHGVFGVRPQASPSKTLKAMAAGEESGWDVVDEGALHRSTALPFAPAQTHYLQQRPPQQLPNPAPTAAHGGNDDDDDDDDDDLVEA